MIVFGMIHSYLVLWTGEILFYYGMAGMFLHPLRKLAPRVLFIVAAIGFAISMIWTQGARLSAISKYEQCAAAEKVAATGRPLTKTQNEDIKAWKEVVADRKPDAEKIKKEIEVHQGSYLGRVIHQAPDNAHEESWGVYRYFFDFFSMMLIGMALFRTGVLTLAQPSRVYWLMLLAGYSVGLIINHWETRTLIDSGFTVFAFLQTNVTRDIGRSGYLFLVAQFVRHRGPHGVLELYLPLHHLRGPLYRLRLRTLRKIRTASTLLRRLLHLALPVDRYPDLAAPLPVRSPLLGLALAHLPAEATLPPSRSWAG